MHLLRIAHRGAVELIAGGLCLAVDVVGVAADAAAERAERFAAAARWVAVATRCVP